MLYQFRSPDFRAGVEVIEINSAYTSVIGAVNYAQELGISIHLAAAIAIARRGLGFSEKLSIRNGLVPTRNGSHAVRLILELRCLMLAREECCF